MQPLCTALHCSGGGGEGARGWMVQAIDRQRLSACPTYLHQQAEIILFALLELFALFAIFVSFALFAPAGRV